MAISNASDRSNLQRNRLASGVRLCLAFALMIPLAACATKRDIRDLGDELRAQNREQTARMAEILEEQARLEAMIQSLSTVEDERQALILQRFRELGDEVGLLRELTGASQSQIAAIRDQMGRGATSPYGPPSGGFTEGDPSASGEVGMLYEEAVTAHGRGSLATARVGFQDIVDRHPSHDLAPDARYYLADIVAQEGDLDDALRRFLQVAELHPTAERVPEALFRAGVIHRDRGEVERARALFTRVVNTYPDSEVAELARAFLGGN
jgi:TolA-binding protein